MPIRAIATLLMMFGFACGPTTRERTIHATVVATDVSFNAFVVADPTIQQAILDTSHDAATFQARITKYREKRDEALKHFALVFQAASDAAVLSKDPNLITLQKAATSLQAVLEDLAKTIEAFKKETP